MATKKSADTSFAGLVRRLNAMSNLVHLAPLDHEVLKILKSIPGVRILGAPPEAGGAK